MNITGLLVVLQNMAQMRTFERQKRPKYGPNLGYLYGLSIKD